MGKEKYPEDKAVKVWSRKDFSCAILKHGFGHYCGYVIFKKSIFPCKCSDFLTYIPVHGGITFTKYREDGSVVYGFDCGHVHDDENPKTKDMDWLSAQCELLGKMLLACRPYKEKYENCTPCANEEKARLLDEFREKFPEAEEGFNMRITINLLSGRL